MTSERVVTTLILPVLANKLGVMSCDATEQDTKILREGISELQEVLGRDLDENDVEFILSESQDVIEDRYYDAPDACRKIGTTLDDIAAATLGICFDDPFNSI